MTPTSDNPNRQALSSSRTAWGEGLRQTLALFLSLAVTGGFLVFLLWGPSGDDSKAAPARPTQEESARITATRTLAIQPGSTLEKKLAVVRVNREQVSAPVLTVTGSAVARLSPGEGSTETRWDFSTAELATSYADWLKARAEVPFTEKQLAKVRELSDARLKAQTKKVEDLRAQVKIGTEPKKDLIAAEAERLQIEIQGNKDVFEAETAFKNASRTRATLERQLFQIGVDPHLLGKAPEGAIIIAAEVPEARIHLVKPGQACAARFFAFPGKSFKGKVGSLGPALARERRTLRVFFELPEPKGELRATHRQLRPGMFAEIGLGTEPRAELLVPAEAVLHVGRSDYVLAAVGKGEWRITEVDLGEAHGPKVEIRSGLQAGNRVIGAGAILLQPLVIQAVRE